ncbi:MAG TPA: antibiotic biosynthesis monooxygenase [Ktedonobacteraceae bacterium]|jgi:heme-degrading monooxygenase HmoA|nr:antibiotic biosynthesis monooxygenase [Ktedonobacteraceae bacterium]
MYARVTTLQWQIGKKVEAMDEAIQIVKESIVPVSKQQPGFKGFLTLLDRKGGKVILLTLWETEAALKAGEASGYYREQIAKFAHLSQLYVTPPYREVYELIVQEST